MSDREWSNQGRGSGKRSAARAIRACWLATAWIVAGCGPSQVGEGPEAFRSVDALFTAVSLRDPNLVTAEMGRLRALADSGALPKPAFEALETIAAEAKSGEWAPAQDQLREFMRGQRR